MVRIINIDDIIYVLDRFLTLITGSNKPTTKLERAIEFRKESNVAPQETEEVSTYINMII
jgi:hypothetical protein